MGENFLFLFFPFSFLLKCLLFLSFLFFSFYFLDLFLFGLFMLKIKNHLLILLLQCRFVLFVLVIVMQNIKNLILFDQKEFWEIILLNRIVLSCKIVEMEILV